MNQTQHLIDNARNWLANPKNATHPNRTDIENDLRGLEGRAPAPTLASAASDADIASQIVALYVAHTGASGNNQITHGYSRSADTEAALVAQILATVTPLRPSDRGRAP